MLSLKLSAQLAATIFLRLHLLHFGECEIWSSSIAFALCEIEIFRETRIDSTTTQLQFNLLSSVDDIIAAGGDPSAGLRMNLNTSVTQVRVHTHYMCIMCRKANEHMRTFQGLQYNKLVQRNMYAC